MEEGHAAQASPDRKGPATKAGKARSRSESGESVANHAYVQCKLLAVAALTTQHTSSSCALYMHPVHVPNEALHVVF